MTWNTTIFAYCERGLDRGLWAEPLNAVSSLAFLITAAAGFGLWRRDRGGPMRAELALVVLTAVIGTGSFLFHTFATPWARLADTGPIGIFMIAYLAYALRRFAGLGAVATGLWMAAFVGSLVAAASVTCGAAACLNGSLGYVPALVALVVVGSATARRRHPAARPLLLAAVLFLASLAFRTVDRMVCPYTIIVAARSVGTHFLWHLLNAAMLLVLLHATVRHGRPATPERHARSA